MNILYSISEDASIGIEHGIVPYPLQSSDTYAFSYDAMKRLVTDPRRGLQFSYNLANLPSKVEGMAQDANAGLTLDYRYLSDGTKVSATLTDGDSEDGLRYRGNFIYLLRDGEELLSSVPWSDGRSEFDNKRQRARIEVIIIFIGLIMISGHGLQSVVNFVCLTLPLGMRPQLT